MGRGAQAARGDSRPAGMPSVAWPSGTAAIHLDAAPLTHDIVPVIGMNGHCPAPAQSAPAIPHSYTGA